MASRPDAQEEGAPEAPPVYLDFNATTPVLPEVVSAMLPFLTTHYGNPSSSHALGRRARAAVDEARGRVAALLNAPPDSVLFMSCATETINYAVKGAALRRRREDGALVRIVASAVEHPATVETVRFLEREHGFEVVWVAPGADGVVEAARVAEAVDARTALVTVMAANNEVGALNDVAAIAAAARARCPGVLVHTDASQAVGKTALDVAVLGVDMLTVAGHKIYAPKGVGALYVRPGTPEFEPLLHGAGHEGGRRAGTESVAMAVALGAACAAAARDYNANVAHLASMRARLVAALRHEAAGRGLELRFNGPEDPARRLPNTVSVGIRGTVSGLLKAAVEAEVACSAGAACHEGGDAASARVSSVLAAMRVPREFAVGTLRLSVGVTTKAGEVDLAARVVCEAAAKMKAAAA